MKNLRFTFFVLFFTKVAIFLIYLNSTHYINIDEQYNQLSNDLTENFWNKKVEHENDMANIKIENEPEKPKLIIFWPPYEFTLHAYFKRCRYPCESTKDVNRVNEATAIVFNGWIFPKAQLPTYRHKNQRWIYFIAETPINTYYHSNDLIVKNFNGVFNWTLSYRSDSDIKIQPWHFKRLANDKSIEADYGFYNKKFAVALISNCKNVERLSLIKQLQEQIPNSIDFYGSCGKSRFNGSRVDLLKQYKFVIAFENSFYCKDYITEKFWINALIIGGIPIVKGASKMDFINQGIPNEAYIHVDDFSNIQDLAEYLVQINNSESLFNSYHSWRSKYRIMENYIGYWCDVCHKLHEDKEEKVYEQFDEWYNSCEGFRVN